MTYPKKAGKTLGKDVVDLRSRVERFSSSVFFRLNRKRTEPWVGGCRRQGQTLEFVLILERMGLNWRTFGVGGPGVCSPDGGQDSGCQLEFGSEGDLGDALATVSRL